MIGNRQLTLAGVDTAVREVARAEEGRRGLQRRVRFRALGVGDERGLDVLQLVCEGAALAGGTETDETYGLVVGQGRGEGRCRKKRAMFTLKERKEFASTRSNALRGFVFVTG